MIEEPGLAAAAESELKWCGGGRFAPPEREHGFFLFLSFTR